MGRTSSLVDQRIDQRCEVIALAPVILQLAAELYHDAQARAQTAAELYRQVQAQARAAQNANLAEQQNSAG